ncbi:MAG: MarR family transcriptional regulator [Phenylobacterium zucineum]|nr:MAG: MarR family transcriptional regulator [Phenylobacterium zucineum]
MNGADSLILTLLQGFFWFDDGLQAHLQARGWTEVTRPQSMVMTNVVIGVQKPSDIARNLGVSRQSVHATINQMVEKGMLELVDDPDDGRAKIVVLSEVGQRMRADADRAMGGMVELLKRRIGARNVEALVKAFREDWGDPPTPTST